MSNPAQGYPEDMIISGRMIRDVILSSSAPMPQGICIFHTVQRHKRKNDRHSFYIILVFRILPVIPVLPQLKPPGTAEHHPADQRSEEYRPHRPFHFPCGLLLLIGYGCLTSHCLVFDPGFEVFNC